MRESNDGLQVWWTKKANIPCAEKVSFERFLNKMSRRIVAGHHQYGLPNKRKRYMTRMELELKEYKRTGNVEHLVNIANYAWLENEAPENKNFHFDNTVDSVTRGKIWY